MQCVCLCVRERHRGREAERERQSAGVGLHACVCKTFFLHSEIQISKIMQKLTQFAGSRQILRGYGKNTDGHQALKGPRLGAISPTCTETS